MTIAIIDDQLVIVELLAEFLMDEGYEVFATSDPVAGLAYLQEQPPDLLILDLMMPVLSGWDIFDQVRNNAARPFPIILMTAAPRQAVLEYQRRNQQQSVLLAKPLGLDELLATIERLLADRGPSSPSTPPPLLQPPQPPADGPSGNRANDPSKGREGTAPLQQRQIKPQWSIAP